MTSVTEHTTRTLEPSLRDKSHTVVCVDEQGNLL
jgi:hypothetical protein